MEITSGNQQSSPEISLSDKAFWKSAQLAASAGCVVHDSCAADLCPLGLSVELLSALLALHVDDFLRAAHGKGKLAIQKLFGSIENWAY